MMRAPAATSLRAPVLPPSLVDVDVDVRMDLDKTFGPTATVSPATRVKVVLADACVLFREALKVALHATHACAVVAEAARGREVYDAVEHLRPDVLVLDLLLADTDGVSALRELKRRRLKVPALMLSRVAHPAFVRDALAAGVHGFALKHQPLREVRDAMAAVAAGEKYLAPALADDLRSPAPRTGFDLLSAREREVFWRILDGRATKGIAGELCVSAKTVEAHRYRINRKLGVRSTTQLLRFAATEGLM